MTQGGAGWWREAGATATIILECVFGQLANVGQILNLKRSTAVVGWAKYVDFEAKCI